jgi:hypothetical protein
MRHAPFEREEGETTELLGYTDSEQPASHRSGFVHLCPRGHEAAVFVKAKSAAVLGSIIAPRGPRTDSKQQLSTREKQALIAVVALTLIIVAAAYFASVDEEPVGALPAPAAQTAIDHPRAAAVSSEPPAGPVARPTPQTASEPPAGTNTSEPPAGPVARPTPQTASEPPAGTNTSEPPAGPVARPTPQTASEPPAGTNIAEPREQAAADAAVNRTNSTELRHGVRLARAQVRALAQALELLLQQVEQGIASR